MDVNIPETPAEYDAYRAEVRAFVDANRPTLKTKKRNGLRVPEYAEDIEALRQWVSKLYEAGYQMVGNKDPDPVRLRVLREEIGRSGLPTLLGNTTILHAIEQFGSDEQKEHYLPRIYSGEYVCCQLFSEPDAGSDLASLRTRAVRDGNVYVLHGQKVWTTYGQWADFGFLLARTDPDVEKHKGISAFIMPMKVPGVDVRPMRECVGTADFNEVFFDGAEVPAENLIGVENDGWRIATAALVGERSGMGGGGHGPTGTVMELFELAKQTRRNGVPLVEETAWRYRLADLYAQAEIQRFCGYTAVTKAQRGTLGPADAPVGKVIFSELNLALAEAAMAMLGSDAVLVENDPRAHRDGHWQDWFLYARAYMIGGGTNEIMRNLIAERGLALPRA